MNFPFFNRLPLKKITPISTSDASRQAEQMLTDILTELPEALLAYVFDSQAAKLLAFYTTSASYNPHQLTVRNAKMLHTVQEALAAGAWVGGPCTDLTIMLDNEVHYLRPLHERGWYCFVAMKLAASNIAMVKEVIRRHTI